MELFETVNADLDAFLMKKKERGKSTRFDHERPISWTVEAGRNLVLEQDTAVELGNPKNFSTAGLFWLDDPQKVHHGRITIVGSDIGELEGRKISFGKILRVGIDRCDPENDHTRYLEMELVRYRLNLKGYMMRGVSQYQREWVRISQEALDKGFSFKILGGGLVDAFSRLDYVNAVEVVFVTSGRNDVAALHGINEKAGRIIRALQKRSESHATDCATCDYKEICLKIDRMKNAYRKKKDDG